MFRNYFDLFLSTIWFYTKLCSFNISICRFVQNRFHWCRLRPSFCKTERYGNKMHQVWRKENQIQTCPDLSRPGQAWPHLSGCIPGQAWSVAIQESRICPAAVQEDKPFMKACVFQKNTFLVYIKKSENVFIPFFSYVHILSVLWKFKSPCALWGITCAVPCGFVHSPEHLMGHRKYSGHRRTFRS